ncbi:MAG TPA: protein kinase, partial [Thermoanaerobaculia bacterium]|nr:protein kinase [Thermoanaerobaculia bacterium]
MTLAAGTKLGPYEILSPLGAGGMGEVYRAKDTKLNREVAIKVLPESLSKDPDALARFEREAHAIAALNHPNILSIHDFGNEGGIAFAVTELLVGETLRARVDEGALAQRRAVEIAIQIAKGLAAAHEKGIVHRDLKPENVFLTADSRVKILDFGLAKRIGLESGGTSAPTTAGTEPGTVMGTVGYMSPEQVRGRDVDHRTDIFAFGAILYEMLAGKRAFKGNSAVETMNAILKEDPPELLESGRNIAPALDRIVRHCLEKSPESRFHSAGDIAFDLDAISNASTSSARAISARPGKRSKFSLAARLVGAAALLALAYFAGRRLAPESGAAEGWHFQQLTFGRSAELPSLSPDGTQFLFVRREGKAHIFLQRVGGQNAVDLTPGSVFNNSEPVFSPDGTRIAFVSDRDGGGIYVMGATGESMRRVADGGFAPSWSPDGSSLVYMTTLQLDPYHFASPGDVMTVELQSGKKRTLLKGQDFDATLAAPAWSPHGNRIALYGVVGSGAQRDLFTIDARAQKPKPLRLIEDKPLDWAPAWSPDGRSIYFGSDRGGTLDLYRIGVDEATGKATSAPQRVSIPAGSAGPFSLSHDGSRIAYEVDSTNYGIQRFAFDPARRELADTPKTILAGLPVTSYVAASPDGSRLLFQAGVTRENIYACDVNGGDLAQLTDDGFKNRQPRWYADGKKIVFYSTRGGSYQVWEMGVDGGQARLLTSPSLGYFLASIPTPAGERIATFMSKGTSSGLAVLRRQPDGQYLP